MAPRTAAGSSNGVKQEGIKVKAEKVKQEKVNGKRRAETPVEEEQAEEDAQGEEEGEQEQEEAEEGGSPRGNKRRRVNGDGDSAPTEDGSPEPMLPRVKTLPRGADGYIPGSIVRIQLQNFVTYDFVEFKPGPYLNMIFGPNGTGKSSIACAIALGLNFPPAILGRATELNQFVKNGTDAGYIEIELKGPADKPNLVIRRNLKAISKGSTFTLNGHAATGAEIKTQMAELNVQVGNLCSFLPQDRVSEFAAMTSQQLLRETQRAAGDENLTRWHDTLIEAGKDLHSLQNTIKSEEDSLKQMKDRNEGIERDVQRYKERKAIEHTIALLNVLIPVAQYREIRQRFTVAKAAQRQLHAKVARLKKKNEPAHELLKRLEQNVKDIEKERERLKQSTQRQFLKLTEKNKASDALETAATDIIDQLDNLKKEEKDRARQIASLENEIVKLKAEAEKPRPADLPTEEEVKDAFKQVNLLNNALGSQIDEFNAKMTECTNKKAQARGKLDHAEKRLQNLNNVDTQRLKAMERWDKDTHDAIVWVRANRNLFKMEVFETPFMRLTVKDRNYADAIESCFGQNQMKAFIAQCKEDVDVLNRNINDQGVLGRRVRITTWFRPTELHTIIPPPMSREEMSQQGFDGYAMDYIDCPEGMQYFLQKDINLHRTAVALDPRRVNVGQVMELVGRPNPETGHGGGANFIVGNTLNIVNRSRYGRKALGNMTRDVLPARNLNAPTIDPAVRRGIDDDIKEANQELVLCDEEIRDVKEKNSNVEEEKREIDRLHAAAQKKKKAMNEYEKNKISAQTKLTSKMKTLKGLKAKPSAEAKRADLKAKLMKNNQDRMVLAEQYTVLVHSIIHEQQLCTHAGLKYLQVGANKAALSDLCERKDVKYHNALREYTQANELFQEIKANSKRILEESRVVLDEAPEDVQDEYNAIEEVRLAWEQNVKLAKEEGQPPPEKENVESRTADELETELGMMKASLDMLLNTNPGVVEQYEKRKRDIETLEKTIAERKKKEERIQKNIKNARDNWHPALKTLVDSIGQKFSAAFDRIGCAGEVRISEHEDYDKWAIDILVKFRSSEKLQLLTAHRQSGGERSLTTILYLMSLTEEARAPFSLVDEINQGMDQRAERVVHNSMVNVTCKADSAQYFLITPKLLPDLEYHERMKVLCVNNGEWLPEDRDVSGRMMDMIEGYVKARGAGAAAH